MAVRHIIAVSALALTAACASQSEVDQLRADVNALRSEMATVRADLSQTKALATQAAADAAAAKACCDRMRGGLRK